MRSKLLILILALGCVACVVVSLTSSSEAPYPADLLKKLSTSEASKDTVRKALGHPQISKDSGEYWFYAVIREVVGILGGPSGALIEDYEWVAFQFNEADQVIFVEHSDYIFGCLSNGICHIEGLFSNSPKTVLTAPFTQDYETKQRRVESDECAVYFYQVPVLPFRAPNVPVILSVDERVLGAANYETYLFFTHPPGDILLGAYQFQITVKCRGGEKLYVRAVETGWSTTTGKDLAPVGVSEGEAAIDNRRLALPN